VMLIISSWLMGPLPEGIWDYCLEGSIELCLLIEVSSRSSDSATDYFVC